MTEHRLQSVYSFDKALVRRRGGVIAGLALSLYERWEIVMGGENLSFMQKLCEVRSA